jgi:hypothetical protein
MRPMLPMLSKQPLADYHISGHTNELAGSPVELARDALREESLRLFT